MQRAAVSTLPKTIIHGVAFEYFGRETTIDAAGAVADDQADGTKER